MKKMIYSLLAGAMMLTSCTDFTEIQPKGMSMLGTTTELEMLFNQDLELSTRDLGTVGGSTFFSYGDILAGFNVVNKSLTTLLIGYFDDDQSISRIESLTTSDSFYSNCYSWVGTICNPTLNQLAFAEGSDAHKKQLRSEALALRAYAHYLILQKYAKAYNPSTAANDPGVIYLTEDVDIAVNQEKKSVQECYEMALADINAAIEEGGLPNSRSNAMRLSKAAGYAIKAHICMAMQKYAEAEDAAKQALALNKAIYDFWGNRKSETNRWGGTYEYSEINCLQNPENYLCTPEYFYDLWVTPEDWNNMENGYYTKELVEKISNAYLGMPESAMEDPNNMPQDVKVGVPGWEGIENLGGDCYDSNSGLTTTFMYLYCAECELRSGNISNAMDYLDQLRKARMSAETYSPLKGVVTTKADAITWMKRVSFEENVWNGWNFMQRKRWNVESEWTTTLSRTIGGTTYTLSPKSNLWVFPFPQPARNANPNLISNKNN
ncbi:MAG: RagB/SusD family nutrient uptake outer membrane protein [Prevotella sp.]|nr:RagB/SusD family nutrient uptake outer membrane protein [Prevotella sp.]